MRSHDKFNAAWPQAVCHHAFDAHIGWNFTLAGLFSVPVSGHPVQGMFQGELSGPNGLTGGPLGVEGSVFAVIAVLAASAALLRYVAKGQIVAPSWRMPKDNALDVPVIG